MIKVNIEISIEDLIKTYLEACYVDRFMIPKDFTRVLKASLYTPVINDNNPIGVITGFDNKMIYGQLWVNIETQNTVKTTLDKDFKILLEKISAVVIKFKGDE